MPLRFRHCRRVPVMALSWIALPPSPCQSSCCLPGGLRPGRTRRGSLRRHHPAARRSQSMALFGRCLDTGRRLRMLVDPGCQHGRTGRFYVVGRDHRARSSLKVRRDAHSPDRRERIHIAPGPPVTLGCTAVAFRVGREAAVRRGPLPMWNLAGALSGPLDDGDVHCSRALLTLLHVKRDPIAFIEGLEAHSIDP